MTGRVTLQDVARRAGVSRSTASNVVMGTGRVSEATRERVRQAMTDLGYVYHQAAAQLRRQTSRTVGVIVTNIDRPHFGELLVGLSTTLAGAGYTPLVVSTRDQLDLQEKALSTLREHQVAALAMVPATNTSGEVVDALTTWGVPAVFVTRYVRGRDFPYVGPDDSLGGYLAGTHLVEHGCTSISYVGGFAQVNSRIDRMSGVLEGIGEATQPIAFSQLESEPTGEGGYRLGEQMLAGGPLPDGVVCHGDLVAMGFCRALYEAGRAGEVRVVSFDDIAATRYFIPSLTTVASNGGALGTLAAESLLGALTTGEPAATHRVPPVLRIRESCGDHDQETSR